LIYTVPRATAGDGVCDDAPVQIRVRQIGGTLGLDRVTQVDDAGAQRLDAGELTAERPVGEAAAARIEELADQVQAVDLDSLPEPSGTVIDAVDLEVRIGEGPEALTFTYSTAAAVPQAVSDLVRAVVAAPYRDINV